MHGVGCRWELGRVGEIGELEFLEEVVLSGEEEVLQWCLSGWYILTSS